MYPESFARFYDVIYHQLRDSVDNQFFLEQVVNTKGKILEIGVGTGRLFTAALQQGADIYGIDVSRSMIEILNQKLDPENRKRIDQQNIVDFKLRHKFDLVIAPFRVLMHLQDKAEQLKALNNVYRNLKPGGIFIFDVFIPDLKQLIAGLQNQVDFNDEYMPGQKLKRTVSTRPDLLNQLIVVTFQLDWEEEGETRHDEWTLPLRYFFRYELEHLVERSDFDSYSFLGDYSGSALGPDSKDYIVICRKA